MAMNDLITISSSVLPDGTRVVAFRGAEAISRPYEIEIYLSLEGEEGDGLDLADAIGAKAQLVIDRTDDALPPYVFAGILANLDLLHAVEGRSLVRAVLVPRLWQLGLSKHSRIFTKKSLPDVIESILEDNGLSGEDYELRLGKYETEEHICQYRESDLDFISRWMEREGMYYFFVHGEEGEKLVIADDKSYEEDMLDKPIRYYPQLGQDRSAGASFRSFTSRHRTLPAMVKLKDYDYARPNLNVAGSAKVASNGAGEVSLYGERFFSPAAGDRLAKLRAEELLARAVVYHAAGTRTHLRAGHVFELEEHPRAALNTRYLAIEVRHHGNQAGAGSNFSSIIEIEHDEVYFCEIDAIPAATQFRAETRAPWPRIFGYENGIVDGSADSEYAQIDDQGRYACKFKFDESTLKDGKASTFVRMMQPHGGGVEGFHFPLRKGTEVVFSFLGGDPDRPVVSGVVPNALTPSPVTSGNHTKNIIQTGGRNRIELEDKNGQQRFTMSTPHHNSYIRMGYPNDGHSMIFQTDHNTFINAGESFDLWVGVLNDSGYWHTTVKNNMKTYVQDGGIGIGVKLVPGDPAAGVFGLAAESHISMQSTTGNYSLNVDAGRSTTNIHSHTHTTVAAGEYVVNVTGGMIQLKNNDSLVEVWGNDNVHLHSEKKASLHGKTEVEVKAIAGPLNMSATENITISTPSKTVKIDCTKFEDTSQEKKSCWGSITDVATGKWTILKGAEWFEMGVSAKMEISASLKAAISFAVSLEFSKGLSIKNASGPAEIKIKTIDIKTRTVTIDSQSAQISSANAARLQRAGITIVSG
jgi:type VI secretion system secreted protein VgrG